MERRTLVRLLVGVGIGVPIAIEAATFLGLFGARIGGDGGAPTPTATPRPDAVGVGDELLPATPQRETVAASRVTAESGERTFVLVVEVANDAETGYELRLDALTTAAGTTVTGGGSSDRLAPGDRATVTGRWPLPAGETPATVIAVATLTRADGSRDSVTRRVAVEVDD